MIYGHCHDFQAACKVVWHIVDDFRTIRPGFDHAGPKDHGRIFASLEGIELNLGRIIFVTTERFRMGDEREFRHDQIQKLRRLHLQ